MVKEDKELFESMKGKYVSENERIFFETMEYKQANQGLCGYEYLLYGDTNDDHIYFYREAWEEYVFGQILTDKTSTEAHVMCLAYALSTNLKEEGLIDLDMTLWEWFRSVDYKGFDYNTDTDC